MWWPVYRLNRGSWLALSHLVMCNERTTELETRRGKTGDGSASYVARARARPPGHIKYRLVGRSCGAPDGQRTIPLAGKGDARIPPSLLDSSRTRTHKDPPAIGRWEYAPTRKRRKEYIYLAKEYSTRRRPSEWRCVALAQTRSSLVLLLRVARIDSEAAAS